MEKQGYTVYEDSTSTAVSHAPLIFYQRQGKTGIKILAIKL
jgi:hypothetical protein